MNIYYPTIEEFDKSFPGLGQEMILEVPSKKELFSVNCGENHFNYKHGKLIGAKNNPEIQRRYQKKYEESPEGKAVRKKYNQSPKGKATQKKMIAKNIAETGYADRRSAPDGSRASKRKERDGRVRKSRKTPSPVYLRVND